jgi:hypothetical protein
MGFHQVPNMFSMCSQRVFPIAPCFNTICFAERPPLLTYVGGQMGRHFIFPKNLLFGGASIISTFFSFCNGPIKLAHCKKEEEEEKGLVRDPQLINMKQNK